MPRYAYKARSAAGEAVSGTLAAAGEGSALATLERQGLFPIDLRLDPSDSSATKTGLGALLSGPVGGRGASAETIARIATELSELIRAGVPLLNALDILVAGAERGVHVVWGGGSARGEDEARRLLADVRTDVAGGSDLAGALEKRPGLFPPATTGIVRAGEAGGFLAEALARVAEYTEREASLKSKIRTAMAYPVLLSVLGAGAIVFLVTWVVPRLSVIYDDLGSSLPWQTQLLLVASDVLQEQWMWFVGALVAAVLIAVRLLSSEGGRRWLDGAALRVPLVRGVVGRASLARFLRTLGALLRSGVPILTALEIARGASGNREFAERLAETLPDVREGSPLVEPLSRTGLIPPAVLEMIAVGQESATLDQVLERAGERTEEEVERALRVLTTVLEPILITIMAGIVFFIVLATLLPIFTLNTLVK